MRFCFYDLSTLLSLSTIFLVDGQIDYEIHIFHYVQIGVVYLFSRVLRDSTTRFVGPSVGPSVRLSVRPSHFTFLGFLRSLASLLLPK